VEQVDGLDVDVMEPFADSTNLLDDAPALRRRFDEDGYVFVRDVVDGDVLQSLRQRVIEACDRHGWLADPADAAVPRVAPLVEGDEGYFEAYDDIYRLEEFHALPHHESVMRVMRTLLGDTAFPHPLGIARLAFPDNDMWTTPPHQDFPNNQGTSDLYACWIPLGDCPLDLGPLSILQGSHRLGLLPLEFSLGAGNRRAVLDERHDRLQWVGGDFRAGDVVVFHSLTVHRALPNRCRGLRLSVDYRFQREGEPLTEGCLEPHFGRLSWDQVYQGWSRQDLQYYWRTRRFTVTPWDESLHALGEAEMERAVRAWLQWKTHVASKEVQGAEQAAAEAADVSAILRAALAEEMRAAQKAKRTAP
jgi:ectoine hydroxylase-related dioxygenase (phytanoyl-CoA dioxygenase family)